MLIAIVCEIFVRVMEHEVENNILQICNEIKESDLMPRTSSDGDYNKLLFIVKEEKFTRESFDQKKATKEIKSKL